MRIAYIVASSTHHARKVYMPRKLIKTIQTGENHIHARTVKVYRDSDFNEFQCVLMGYPDATYHTEDKADALHTAQHMIDFRNLI